MKGATQYSTTTSRNTLYFNPRSREGSDDEARELFKNGLFISIHAPVKGATTFDWLTFSYVTDFNPRSREGSDMDFNTIEQSFKISIHAPVKGATFFRGDLNGDDLISIHAPVKGATF